MVDSFRTHTHAEECFGLMGTAPSAHGRPSAAGKRPQFFLQNWPLQLSCPIFGSPVSRPFSGLILQAASLLRNMVFGRLLCLLFVMYQPDNPIACHTRNVGLSLVSCVLCAGLVRGTSRSACLSPCREGCCYRVVAFQDPPVLEQSCASILFAAILLFSCRSHSGQRQGVLGAWHRR